MARKVGARATAVTGPAAPSPPQTLQIGSNPMLQRVALVVGGDWDRALTFSPEEARALAAAILAEADKADRR